MNIFDVNSGLLFDYIFDVDIGRDFNVVNFTSFWRLFLNSEDSRDFDQIRPKRVSAINLD